ncbi:hypothetical protein [Sediminitomix flava]|uniref:Uncharacterized protein n=1 Tax=Sediminitomix flava TaxID=379075 RepID=A0A315Z4J2_SEDFL|nr:hypothetical protein [Sediminitomix flava]PWJ38009.1 hypothetical protein BC781_108144 [Sediminitomix flava]
MEHIYKSIFKALAAFITVALIFYLLSNNFEFNLSLDSVAKEYINNNSELRKRFPRKERIDNLNEMGSIQDTTILKLKRNYRIRTSLSSFVDIELHMFRDSGNVWSVKSHNIIGFSPDHPRMIKD